MSGLLIYGAGGHGKVVAEAADAAGQWDTIRFDADPNLSDDNITTLSGQLARIESYLQELSTVASLETEVLNMIKAELSI